MHILLIIPWQYLKGESLGDRTYM